MSFISKIISHKKPPSSEEHETLHKTFLHFMEAAALEIDDLISKNPNWYSELPYFGPMGPDEARKLEIEKRALWRRVIYDAGRSKLAALRWETSKDNKVCPECREYEDRIFFFNEYNQLNLISMHVGCRCNLVPVRDAEAVPP